MHFKMTSLVITGMMFSAATAKAQEYSCSVTYFNYDKAVCGSTGSEHCGEITGVLKNPTKAPRLTVAAITASNVVLYAFDVETSGKDTVIFKKSVSTPRMSLAEENAKKVAKCIAQ
jgi:hypothetical protein